MVHFMNLTLTEISLYANIGLAVITLVYACLTYRLVTLSQDTLSDARLQSQRDNRPYIDVVALQREGATVFQLRIGNTGRNAAKNVRLSLSKQFYQRHQIKEKYLLQNMHPFKETIASFSPKLELVLDLGISYEFFLDLDSVTTPLDFEVRAQYEWEGLHFDETTPIDIRVFARSSAAASGVLQEYKDINKQLQEMTKAINSLHS